jgi:hypothetical protein
MSTQLFEEETPPPPPAKSGRGARNAPTPKEPEIALSDPFADEPEAAVVSAVEEEVPVQPAPEPEPTPAPVAPVAEPPAPSPALAVAPTPTPAPVAVVAAAPAGPRTLPDERQSLTLTLKAGGCEGLVIVGLFEDGTPGEVLLLLRKAPAGATEALEAFAATLTLALPYGIPAGVLASQLLTLLGDSSAHEAARAITVSLSARFS